MFGNTLRSLARSGMGRTGLGAIGGGLLGMGIYNMSSDFSTRGGNIASAGFGGAIGGAAGFFGPRAYGGIKNIASNLMAKAGGAIQRAKGKLNSGMLATSKVATAAPSVANISSRSQRIADMANRINMTQGYVLRQPGYVPSFPAQGVLGGKRNLKLANDSGIINLGGKTSSTRNSIKGRGTNPFLNLTRIMGPMTTARDEFGTDDMMRIASRLNFKNFGVMF